MFVHTGFTTTYNLKGHSEVYKSCIIAIDFKLKNNNLNMLYYVRSYNIHNLIEINVL